MNLAKYAGAAAGASQKVESANKLFAAFTSIAKDSRTAATLTKTAFQGLTQEATVKGLKSIGVELYDATGNLRNLESVLTDVDGKFKKMSPKAIDQLINRIGGPEGLRALLTKLKTGADNLFTTFEGFDASKFNMDKALENAKNDVTVLSKRIKNKLNVIMAKLGDRILPLVAKGLKWIERILDKIYNNFDRVVRIVKTAVVVFTAFKATNMLLAFSFNTSLAFGIDKATLSMKKFNLAFKSNMVGLITSLIAGLAYQIFSLKTESEAFQKFLEKEKRFDKRRKDLVNNSNLDFNKANVKGLTVAQANTIKNAATERIKGLDDIMLNLKGIIHTNNVNARNIRRLNDEIKVLKAEGRTTPYAKQQLEKKRGDIDVNIRELTKGFTLKDISSIKKKNQAIINRLSGRKLITGDDENTGGSETTLATTGGDIENVGTAAASPKTIIIENIVLNEGGINTQNTTLQNMSAEEIEAWFNEAMMRVIRGVELS